MTVPNLKILEDWGWLPLWEALDKGHHKFAHDFMTKANDTDIGPKVIMAARFVR